MKKTFLLGIGAQKAGTTWLYQYLSEHPSCDFTLGKEYHDLNWFFAPATAISLQPTIPKIEALQEHLGILATLATEPFSPTEMLLAGNLQKRVAFFQSCLAFRETQQLYLDHFARIAAQDHERHVVGDITPAYSSLPHEAYRWLADGMAERGLRTKILFVMRDPVERVISQFRMMQKLKPKMFENRSGEAALRALYRSSAVEVRTRYENTLRTLDAAFAANESLSLFFEELFREDALARLCGHLGIAYEPAVFDVRVNESEGPAPDIDGDLQREIARHYSSTYAFVAERFGEASMRRLWRGYELLA